MAKNNPVKLSEILKEAWDEFKKGEIEIFEEEPTESYRSSRSRWKPTRRGSGYGGGESWRSHCHPDWITRIMR